MDQANMGTRPLQMHQERVCDEPNSDSLGEQLTSQVLLLRTRGRVWCERARNAFATSQLQIQCGNSWRVEPLCRWIGRTWDASGDDADALNRAASITHQERVPDPFLAWRLTCCTTMRAGVLTCPAPALSRSRHAALATNSARNKRIRNAFPIHRVPRRSLHW